MEKARQLLDKINQLYQDNTALSRIETDLLLDYTRQFYDALYEEKMGQSEPAKQYIEALDTTTKKEKKPQPEAFTENEGNTISPFEETASEKIDDGFFESYEIKQESALEKSTQPISRETGGSNKSEQPSIPSQFTPRESKRSISFEAPEPPEIPPNFPDKGIEEEAPGKMSEEISTPQSSATGTTKEPLSDYAQIFKYGAESKTPTNNDIRRHIGINDKYLFLNELFNSEKESYEKALDHLNRLSDYQTALHWVKHEIAETYDWHDDETTQSFYDTLAKHFSER